MARRRKKARKHSKRSRAAKRRYHCSGLARYNRRRRKHSKRRHVRRRRRSR